MPLAIGFNAAAHNSGTIDLVGFAAVDSRMDLQISTRPDFRFGLAPIKTNQVQAAQVVITGLVQRTRYYVRARERNAAGNVIGDWTNVVAFYTPNADALDVTPAGVMVRPGFLVVPEYVQQWIAGDEQAGHPASNLGTDSPNDQWWSIAALPYTLEVELSGAPVDTIALLETNLPRAATWSVKAGNSLANVRGGAPAYSTAPQQFHASPNIGGKHGYHGLIRLPAPQAYRFWRVEIAGAAASLGILNAAYAVFGLARTAKNIAADKLEAAMDLGGLDRTREGNPDRRVGFKMRKVDFEIALMSEAQWETQFADLHRLIGLTEPALVVPNSKEGSFLHDRILFGPVSTMRTTQPFTPRFTKQLSVESLI